MPDPNPWLFIALPTFIAIIYLGFWASEQYTATSQFIIKQSSSQAPSIDLGIPFLTTQTSTSREDALIIQDHIGSVQMLRQLRDRLDLINHYQNPEYDWWARLSKNSTREEQLQYYADATLVSIAPESSIIALETRAFSPTVAAEMNRLILQFSEAFINQISTSLAEAQVDFVRREVEKAEDALAEARRKTLDFQTQHHLLDPESESVSIFSRISEMEGRLSEKRTEFKALSSFMQETSPRVATVRREITALESQIQEEGRILTGGEERSLNQVMAAYQSLKIEQEFALNTYISTLASLETARTDASRQMKFLIIISDNGIPDEASQPKFWRGTFITFILASLIFLVSRLVVATINDHKL